MSDTVSRSRKYVLIILLTCDFPWVRITQVHPVGTTFCQTHECFAAGVWFDDDSSRCSWLSPSRLVIPSHSNCVSFISYHFKFAYMRSASVTKECLVSISNCFVIRICSFFIWIYIIPLPHIIFPIHPRLHLLKINDAHPKRFLGIKRIRRRPRVLDFREDLLLRVVRERLPEAVEHVFHPEILEGLKLDPFADVVYQSLDDMFD